MKKILAAGMSALAVRSLTACSSAGQSSADSQQSAQAQPTTAAVVSQDKGVNQMSFTAPEAYKTVERYIEKYSDGKFAEKDITYNFEDESSICYACMFGIVSLNSVAECVIHAEFFQPLCAEHSVLSHIILSCIPINIVKQSEIPEVSLIQAEVLCDAPHNRSTGDAVSDATLLSNFGLKQFVKFRIVSTDS